VKRNAAGERDDVKEKVPVVVNANAVKYPRTVASPSLAVISILLVGFLELTGRV
jgi:hypothetical protein